MHSSFFLKQLENFITLKKKTNRILGSITFKFLKLEISQTLVRQHDDGAERALEYFETSLSINKLKNSSNSSYHTTDSACQHGVHNTIDHQTLTSNASPMWWRTKTSGGQTKTMQAATRNRVATFWRTISLRLAWLHSGTNDQTTAIGSNDDHDDNWNLIIYLLSGTSYVY